MDLRTLSPSIPDPTLLFLINFTLSPLQPLSLLGTRKMDPFSLKDQCLLLCSTSIHPLILPRHGQALEPLHPSLTCSILPSASAQMGQEGLRLASSEASHCFQHLFLLKIVSNCCPYFLMPTLILPSPIKYYLSPLGTLLLPKIL